MDPLGYDLIIAVVERGFADVVMDAAKAAGASGGTVLNARGAGVHEQRRLFGAMIEPEKELVLILTAHADRGPIMEAITKDAGLSQAGKGICFSLPVDSVTGVRRFAEKKTEIKE